MKRGYTVEEYREMLARVRATIPAAAVTSDFIVGFCGETEEDFQATVELVRESRFKNSFIFKYSERPGTKSSQLFPDDVPEEVKRRRNNELLAIQNAISEADQHAVHRPPGGDSGRGAEQSQPEAPGRRADACNSSAGRIATGSSCSTGKQRQIGQLLPVTIYDANAFTLFGAVVTQHVGPEVYALSL